MRELLHVVWVPQYIPAEYQSGLLLSPDQVYGARLVLVLALPWPGSRRDSS